MSVSDPDGILATPVETVRRERGTGHTCAGSPHWSANSEVVEVVVGLPRTLSDRAGSSADDAVAVAEALAARISPVPVRLADERLTTVSASRSLREAGVRAQRQRGDDRPGRRRGNPAGLARPTPQRGHEREESDDA